MIELKQLHQLELKIALEITNICKRNDLCCMLIYGSLLGAVRHNGFIPWDDDLDIAMPRDDYEKFIRIFQEQTDSEVFFLENWETEASFGLSFSKVKLNNTIFEEHSISKTDTHKGVFVDVFPLDCIPNDPYIIKKTAKKLLWLGKLYKFRQNYLPTNPHDKGQHILGKCIGMIAHIVPKVTIKNWLLKEETRYNDNPSAILTSYLSGAYNCRDLFEKEWISQIIYHDFEGVQLPIPAQYDRILKNIYGDYMKLPPKEDRVFRHNAEKLDFGPYNKEDIKYDTCSSFCE